MAVTLDVRGGSRSGSVDVKDPGGCYTGRECGREGGVKERGEGVQGAASGPRKTWTKCWAARGANMIMRALGCVLQVRRLWGDVLRSSMQRLDHAANLSKITRR